MSGYAVYNSVRGESAACLVRRCTFGNTKRVYIAFFGVAALRRYGSTCRKSDCRRFEHLRKNEPCKSLFIFSKSGRPSTKMQTHNSFKLNHPPKTQPRTDNLYLLFYLCLRHLMHEPDENLHCLSHRSLMFPSSYQKHCRTVYDYRYSSQSCNLFYCKGEAMKDRLLPRSRRACT